MTEQDLDGTEIDASFEKMCSEGMLRFEAADSRYTQTLQDEAVGRAPDGVRKLVLYKGQPVIYSKSRLGRHRQCIGFAPFLRSGDKYQR